MDNYVIRKIQISKEIWKRFRAKCFDVGITAQKKLADLIMDWLNE